MRQNISMSFAELHKAGLIAILALLFSLSGIGKAISDELPAASDGKHVVISPEDVVKGSVRLGAKDGTNVLVGFKMRGKSSDEIDQMVGHIVKDQNFFVSVSDHAGQFVRGRFYAYLGNHEDGKTEGIVLEFATRDDAKKAKGILVTGETHRQ